MSATGPTGEPVFQAAGHPDLFNTSVFFNGQFAESVFGPARPAEAVKNLVFYLPLGMLGDLLVADQCPSFLVETQPETTGCPPGSKVGVIVPLIVSAGFIVEHGIYNVKPEKGYAAEFAFTSNNLTFVSYANVVRHDGTYMIRVSTPGVPATSQLLGVVASIYGHITENFESHEEPQTYDRGAVLTNPSDCGESQFAREGSVAMNTWQHPEELHEAKSMVYPTLTGCNLLTLGAALNVTPETARADAPTGVEVGLEVPQAPNNFTGLGTPPMKNTVVTLPTGTTISPSSANGLEACPATGPNGFNMQGAESEEIAEDGLERPAPGHCSAGSQIATVRGTSPLLNEEVTGKMFLATPECGQGAQGCTPEDVEGGKLIGLDLELTGEHSGTVVKLKGHGSIQRGSGRITTSFENLPQFPVERLTVTTKQGPRAPLENAQTCETSTSNATVTSWSPLTPAATPSDSYAVNWNGTGQPCPGSAPFAPSFTAGTTNPLAASTSPFTLTLRREDREQDVNTLSTTFPEGLLANISKVARCPEPQASEDSLTACPAASQIGTVTAAVGPGSEPFYATGKVFFTGPYAGAPFGLSIVVPAVAGPFNLGDVHTRAKVLIDRRTAQATTVSDPLPREVRRGPAARARPQRDAHQRRIRPEPDELREDEHHRHRDLHHRRQRLDLQPLRRGRMQRPEIRTVVQRLHRSEGDESKRHRGADQGLLSRGRAVEHREGRRRVPEETPGAPRDAAKSMSRRDLRSQPLRVSRRIDRRHGDGAHPDPRAAGDRPRIPRLLRQREISRRRVRPAERRRHRRPRRAIQRLEGRRAESDVRIGPGRAREHVRNGAPRRSLLAVHERQDKRQSARQPMRRAHGRPGDAHRAQRRAGDEEREPHDQGLPQAQKAQSRAPSPAAIGNLLALASDGR